MSLARVANAEGVNSRQVFRWWRAYRQGTLGEPAMGAAALLPVIVAENGKRSAERCDVVGASGSSGSIHIELPGRALITAESGADVGLLRVVLEALRS